MSSSVLCRYEWQLSDVFLHHAFRIAKTAKFWYSMEKLPEGIQIQRGVIGRNGWNLVALYRWDAEQDQLIRRPLRKRSSGPTTVRSEINYDLDQNSSDRDTVKISHALRLCIEEASGIPYHFLKSNCQDFADTVSFGKCFGRRR